MRSASVPSFCLLLALRAAASPATHAASALGAAAATDDDTAGAGVHHRPEHARSAAAAAAAVAANAPGSAASEKVVPRPVGAGYPHISSVSSFLAAKYEKENLLQASLSATDFIMVAALAVSTSADIVSRQEARMPFGGFALPVEQQRYRKGRLYILCGLVEVSWSSKAERKVNPWPEWHMLCGKVFRDELNGKKYAIRTVTPPRVPEKLSDARTRAVVDAAVAGLTQLPRYQQGGSGGGGGGAARSAPRLAAVLSVERQTMDQFSFAKLALSTIPGDVDLYYVAFLTSDDALRDAPPVPHVAAVMRSAKTGVKVVRQVSFGEPGYTILRGAAGIRHMSVFEFNGHMQAKFQAAMARAIGHGIAPEDVEVTGVDVLRHGAVGAADADHSAAAQARLRLRRRRLVLAEAAGTSGGGGGGGGDDVGALAGWAAAEEQLVVAAAGGGAGGAADGAAAAGRTAAGAVGGAVVGRRGALVGGGSAGGDSSSNNSSSCTGYSADAARFFGAAGESGAAAAEAAVAGRRRLGPDGVKVTYTLSVQGGAAAVLGALRGASFATTLAADMVQAGVQGVSGADLSVATHVSISNNEVAAPAGLSLNQLLVLLSAFVLGVLLTTVRAAQLRTRERRAAGGGLQ